MNKTNKIRYSTVPDKIPLAKPQFSKVEKKLVNQCLNTGWISSAGSFVVEFAQKFAKAAQTKYGLCSSSGTTALHLALLALGIGKSDEVIVPALSFVATANAVSYTGAKPIFVDCEQRTWNIDLVKVEEKITKRTKAIIPVHLYGHPVDMDKLTNIAKKYKLLVVEDAAESLGSLYKGKPTGGLSDVGIFSFYGNKIITTGEGGMLVTNNKKIYEKAKLFRDQGKQPKIHAYWHSVIGYNYAMTNLQAAIGIGQLAQLEKFVSQKRKIAKQYNKLLGEIPGITIPIEEKWAKSNCWMYSILVDEKKFALSRNKLMKHLAGYGVETRPFFYTNPLLLPYQKEQKDKFKLTHKISSQGINLPTFSDLKIKEINYIASLIKKASAQ